MIFFPHHGNLGRLAFSAECSECGGNFLLGPSALRDESLRNILWSFPEHRLCADVVNEFRIHDE